MQPKLAFDLPRIDAIDKTVGTGNGRFLGDVANGMSREELVKRWREGMYPDLHAGLAQEAMAMRPHHHPKEL